MRHTLGTAQKATGVSKSTLSRAIKSGRISATKNDDGSYEIDPAELHRVYPPVQERNPSDNPFEEQDATPKTHDETVGLRRELELLREERDRERTQLMDQIEDFRQRLDQSNQAFKDKDTQLTALLTDQREKKERVGEQDKKLQAIEATLQELRNQNRRIAAELANRGFWKWLLGANKRAG
jgi:hypothetical protein